ncbi:deoxyribose-phosphate aldolase [Flavobacterium sp. JP2137]|uniref:deoxyribose-phosphate aldolase n=1 Tax=Flavobacterium sp. JP2137 TaxID=3414510 RepID=UPI003D2FC116
MDLRNYMDSTYLKTAVQAGLSEGENTAVVIQVIQEAIEESFKLVMLRPQYVALARTEIDQAASKVLVGTVIDFPEGKATLEAKIQEATTAIADGADELDFVVNYRLFQQGGVAQVRDQIWKCTQLTLSAGKTVKWIIEVAALTDLEIVQLTTLVKKVALSKFEERQYERIYVKSSTGFYPVEAGKSNGATPASIVLMMENANPLPVKAAGGIRSRSEAEQMIALGVKRLGTSSAKSIVDHADSTSDY